MDTFDIQFFQDEDLAYQATKEGKVWGYVSFHKNFSEAFFGRMWSQIDTDEQTRKESTTQVRDGKNSKYKGSSHSAVLL